MVCAIRLSNGKAETAEAAMREVVMTFVMNDSADAASPKLLPRKSVPRLGPSSLSGSSWAAPWHAVVVSAIPRALYHQQVTEPSNGSLTHHRSQG